MAVLLFGTSFVASFVTSLLDTFVTSSSVALPGSFGSKYSLNSGERTARIHLIGYCGTSKLFVSV